VEDGDEPSNSLKETEGFNLNAPMVPHVFDVLYVFHLIYEEVKLNKVKWTIFDNLRK